MKKNFTSFMQHEYGIFSINDTENGLVGTEGVGPCIVLYVYNPAAKNCFGVHMSTGISFQAVRAPLLAYLNTIPATELVNCKAFFVGGWQAYADLDKNKLENLRSLLAENGITDIVDKLYQKKKSCVKKLQVPKIEEIYAVVGFDLNAGELLIEHTFDNNLQDVDRRSPEVQGLIAQIKPYILMGHLTTISDKAKNIAFSKTDAEFIKSIVDINDGTPLMPRDEIISTVRVQLNALSKYALEGDVANVAKQLFTMLINPCSYLIDDAGLPKKDKWTPLHYACSALNKNSFPKDEYKFQVVLMLMLMQSGKDDLVNAKGQSALDLLKDQYHKDIFTKLLGLCSNLLSGPDKNSASQTLRSISLDLLNDALRYDTITNKPEKMALQGKVINYLEQELADIFMRGNKQKLAGHKYHM